MKWIKILLIWFCIIPAAIINGGIRDYVLCKYLPEKTALAVSGIILSGLILFIAVLLLPRIKNVSKCNSIIAGTIWMLFTICFEFLFGLSSGCSFADLLQAYNPINGNLWILVVFTTFLASMIVVRKIGRTKMTI